jgi:nuclease-like protein
MVERAEQTHPAHAADPDPAAPADPGASKPAEPGPDDGAGDHPLLQRTALARGSRRWVQRADADRRARSRLQFVESRGVIVLNDRREPGSKSSIKLIAVSSSGVFVIDTKNYKGLVHTKRPGNLGNLGSPELHVGRRNCTASVEHVARQMAVVRDALQSTSWGPEVPVQGMLCLTRADWGFASAIEISDVWVGWPKLMAGRVQAPGVMDSPTVQEVSEMIAQQLPVA